MHIMAVHWEEIVPRLIEEFGLPKPVRETAAGPPARARSGGAADEGPRCTPC